MIKNLKPICILIILISSEVCIAQEIHKKIYEDFADNNISEEDTRIIVKSLMQTFKLVQNNFSIIASKSTGYQEKQRTKSRTLNLFRSRSSIVEVTSLNEFGEQDGPPSRIQVETYLNRLEDLSYDKITLYWDNEMALSRLYGGNSGEFQIALSGWQYFIARNREGYEIYSDRTYKTSFFTFMKVGGTWSIKIDEIKAEQTRELKLSPDY